jgi:hypothetical protein
LIVERFGEIAEIAARARFDPRAPQIDHALGGFRRLLAGEGFARQHRDGVHNGRLFAIGDARVTGLGGNARPTPPPDCARRPDMRFDPKASQRACSTAS